MSFLFAILTCCLTLKFSAGVHEAPVILAMQRSQTVIATDTIAPTSDNLFKVEIEQMEPGQYMFVYKGKRLFNFLITNPTGNNITFTLPERLTLFNEIEVSGSPENEAYFQFLGKIQQAGNEIQKYNNTKDIAAAQVVVDGIEAENRHYCDSLAKAWSGHTLEIIASNVFSPQMPQDVAQDALLSYQWQKEHYLDKVDFSNKTLCNTSVLASKIEHYFSKIIPPIADTAALYVKKILDRCTVPENKAAVAQLLFSKYLTSPLMGMDNVAWTIAHDYFLGQGVDMGSTDQEYIAEINAFVEFNAQCLFGAKAEDITLTGLDGNSHSILESLDGNHKYTLLFFYEDGCPVCAKEILDLIEFYNSYIRKDLHVVAIYTQSNDKAFKEYSGYFPKEWTNLWDPKFVSGFQKRYNVRTTPKMYLLNSQKEIVGKNIHTENLLDLISQLEQL